MIVNLHALFPRGLCEVKSDLSSPLYSIYLSRKNYKVKRVRLSFQKLDFYANETVKEKWRKKDINAMFNKNSNNTESVIN